MPKITNNVIRLLETHHARFTAFEVPPEKLSAIEIAKILMVDPSLIYKTIVITREEKAKPILAVVSGNSEVDLKKLAKVVGDKKVFLSTEHEAEQITGLLAGGISPLALFNKGFIVILNESSREQQEIFISGGQRGLIIRLPVEKFIELTYAQVALIQK